MPLQPSFPSRPQHFLLVNLLGVAYYFMFVFGYATDPKGLADSLFYLLITNSLLCALSLQLQLWRCVWLCLCATAAFADYFMSSYGVEINRNTMVVSFQAVPREVDAFDKLGIAIHMLPGFFLGIMGGLIIKRSFPQKKWIFVMLALLPAIFAAGYMPLKGRLDTYVPYNYVAGSYEYWQFAKTIQSKMAKRHDISSHAGRFTNPSTQPLFVVLVLGESARADHFSLNGYARKTNPLLEKTENLVNFPHTTSCGTVTNISVPCMLTHATRGNLTPITTETSLISIFKKLGFETSWLGAQGAFSARDPITVISREATNLHILSPSRRDGQTAYDEELFPYLDRALQAQQNSLIILHTLGSHFQYNERYPKAFEIFKPVCERWIKRPFAYFAKTMPTGQGVKDVFEKVGELNEDCFRKGNLINTYDNTILYTDWFLSQVIAKLRDKNTLFVYVSDHGQSLGENGKFFHLHNGEANNWQVPMMWWASPDFIQHHGSLWQSLQSKSQQAVSHDNLFHSIMDCSGVESQLIDKSLSLCR